MFPKYSIRFCLFALISICSIYLQSCVISEVTIETDSLINQPFQRSDFSISQTIDQKLEIVDQNIQNPIDMRLQLLDQQVQVQVVDMVVVDMQTIVDGWDVARLDTARNEPNFTEAEKALIFRMNQVRTNPSLFKTQFIEPMLNRYEGNVYVALNGDRYQTNEGPSAVRECINYLQTARAVDPLNPSQVLHQSAQAHARDSSMTGIIGHDSSNGTSFVDRLRSYLSANASFGENISYGLTDPLEIVMGFMVDDGVANRGHRDNIMRDVFKYAGSACDTHPTYRSLCVIDYANVPQ